MNLRHPRLRLAVATVLLAGFVAYALCRWVFPFRTVVRPWHLQGTWISAAGPSAAEANFRHRLLLPGEVRNAWLAISGADSYELSVNGRTLSSLALTRATSPFLRSLSETGQQLTASPPMLARQRPREYQWSGFRSWRLPIFVDLTRALAPGPNVLCLTVSSRTNAARLCVEGGILLRSGETVPIRSDRTWKATQTPPRVGGLRWTEKNYPDEDWPAAVAVAPPAGGLLRTLDPTVFQEPFAGEWVQPPGAALDRPVVFETTWRLDERPAEAWVRLVANRAYDLTINGRPVRLPGGGSRQPRHGDWLLDSSAPLAGPSRTESLEAGEVDSVFIEPTASAAVPALALTRDQAVGAFDLFSVPWLLRRGENRLTVRLHPTDETLHWSPQFALDARAVQRDGSVQRFTSGPGWRCRIGEGTGFSSAGEGVATGPADTAEAALPRKNYAGQAWHGSDKLRCWAGTALAAFGAILLAVAAAVRWRLVSERTLATVVVVPLVLLFLAALVESSWVEREEALLFLSENAWGWVLGGALLAAVATALARRPARARRPPARWLAPLRAHWPRLALCWILLLCGYLRARELQFQPFDPDEYASVQAILSVARHGTPQLYDTVYYTRSPLYHYLVGGLVAVFGENVWALRLPSVFFALATAALLYLIGAQLLRSRWTGLVAAALFAVHPFAAFSGYLVRFYQQQQFFALLTVFFFCRGFVVGQRMRDRYAMLAAFFATVLSQELSLTIGLSLLLGYALFAERKPWRSELRFAVVAGCVLTLVFLDLVVFQTRCMTRVDGTSPSLEPALKLNLESPSNLLMLFMVFSRLHLALSLLLLLSLPLLLRERHRPTLALLTLLFSGIVVTAVFVTGSGLRYHYWLIPLWLVLGVHGVRLLTAALLRGAGAGAARPLLRHGLAAAFVAAVLLTWSPWRLWDSGATQMQTDSTGALAYVRRQARPGDAIMVSAPHTQSALLEIGRIDYDLAIPLLHDFFFRKDGRLIDRNAGAEAICNLDMLQQKCADHERLWVLVNREDILRSPGQDIRWRYPGGRTDLFLRTNLDLSFRTYLWDVFLWDRAAGRFCNFRQDR